MRDISAKYSGPATLSIFLPMLDDLASNHNICLWHIFWCRSCRRTDDFGLHQIARSTKWLGMSRDYHVCEHVAQSKTIQSIRGCGHTDDDRRRDKAIERFGIHSRRRSMCFINDGEFGLKVISLDERLDRGDLNRKIWSFAPMPGLDDPVIYAIVVEFLRGLLNKLFAMRDDKDAVALEQGESNKLAEHDGLAGPSRADQQDPLVAAGNGRA